jgi:hypothetical protein
MNYFTITPAAFDSNTDDTYYNFNVKIGILANAEYTATARVNHYRNEINGINVELSSNLISLGLSEDIVMQITNEVEAMAQQAAPARIAATKAVRKAAKQAAYDQKPYVKNWHILESEAEVFNKDRGDHTVSLKLRAFEAHNFNTGDLFQVTYRGVVFQVQNLESRRNLLSYSVDGHITNYRTRTYKSLKSCFTKLTQLIDDTLMVQATKQRVKEQADQLSADRVAMLNQEFVDFKVEAKDVNYRTHGNNYETERRYFIEGIRITFASNYGDRTMDIIAFSGLPVQTAEQVRQILGVVYS